MNLKQTILYLKPVIEDDTNKPSRKRILEIMCIKTGNALTTVVVFAKLLDPTLDVATLTMLIAPLFATGLTYSGITTYYQNKQNGIQNNIRSTTSNDSGSSSDGTPS